MVKNFNCVQIEMENGIVVIFCQQFNFMMHCLIWETSQKSLEDLTKKERNLRKLFVKPCVQVSNKIKHLPINNKYYRVNGLVNTS